MFHDYLTLLLINMTAGLVLLAAYVFLDLDGTNQKRWSPAFAMVGAVAALCGLHMAWTWPLPGSFNCAYGETSVLFGVLFLGAALALAKGWGLMPITIYAFFAGLAAVVVGIRIAHLDMTQAPGMAATGFILTGLGGMLAFVALQLKSSKAFRTIGAIVLLIAALIWLVTAVPGIWGHLSMFQDYKPPTMQ